MQNIGIPLRPERHHWRDKGYPEFSKWMASCDDFFVIRRFSQLNIRILLMMQDAIVLKEKELLQVDVIARQRGEDSSSLRVELNPDRQLMLEELKPMLKEYSDFLATFSQLRNWPSARKSQIENVENWSHNYKYAIDDQELEFLQAGRDVVAPVHKKRSPLWRLLERCDPLTSNRLFRLGPKADQTQSVSTKYYSTTRFNAFVNFVIVLIGLLLIITCIWLLLFVKQQASKVGIVTVFAILFATLLSGATVDRPFEVLGTTSACAALLMVFVQLGADSKEV